MRLEELRANIAIVPQDCVLFNETLMYNIAYGGVGLSKYKKLVDDSENDIPSKVKLLRSVQ